MRHHQKYALTASHLTPLFYAVMIAPLGTCPLLLFLTFEPVMYQLVMGVGYPKFGLYLKGYYVHTYLIIGIEPKLTN